MNIDIGGILGTVGGAIASNIFGSSTQMMASTLVAAVLLALYKVIMAFFRPEQIIVQVYNLADWLVELLDDRLVDKVKSSEIKKDLQAKISTALEESKAGISRLQAKISD